MSRPPSKGSGPSGRVQPSGRCCRATSRRARDRASPRSVDVQHRPGVLRQDRRRLEPLRAGPPAQMKIERRNRAGPGGPSDARDSRYSRGGRRTLPGPAEARGTRRAPPTRPPQLPSSSRSASISSTKKLFRRRAITNSNSVIGDMLDRPRAPGTAPPVTEGGATSGPLRPRDPRRGLRAQLAGERAVLEGLLEPATLGAGHRDRNGGRRQPALHRPPLTGCPQLRPPHPEELPALQNVTLHTGDSRTKP